MEMVRALVRGEVGQTAFLLYMAVFLLLSFLGMYTIYADFTTDSPLRFAFAGGEVANALLLVISEAIYLIIPAILAWKKMSLKEYIKYFVCIDMPLIVLYFSTIIVFVFGTITLLVFGLLPLPGNSTPEMSISLLMFSFVAVSVIAVTLAKIYLMKKLIDLRKEKFSDTSESAKIS